VSSYQNQDNTPVNTQFASKKVSSGVKYFDVAKFVNDIVFFDFVFLKLGLVCETFHICLKKSYNYTNIYIVFFLYATTLSVFSSMSIQYYKFLMRYRERGQSSSQGTFYMQLFFQVKIKQNSEN